MKLSEFDYRIPEEQIAQSPLKDRDMSGLFVLDREKRKYQHRQFRDIVDYLVPGDVLVLNDTKVIPVRIPGMKPSGGKAEITLLRERSVNEWEALVKGVHEGHILLPSHIRATVSRLNGTMARVKFEVPAQLQRDMGANIKDFLNDIGVMPLPVYIKREALQSDSDQYQTVYAKREGAVAAPTAGLHFTDNLIASIKGMGVHIVFLTLHVGYGTFKPVTAEHIKDHQMDKEVFEIPVPAAVAINAAKAEGRRVIAVGTTVTRALESSAGNGGPSGVKGGRGETSLFIRPGYSFRVADALLTNFHLPRSTPMVLASAFAGLDLLKESYAEAKKKGYRFYSYGDAMLIF